jgi:SHS2 domain-containing protein
MIAKGFRHLCGKPPAAPNTVAVATHVEESRAGSATRSENEQMPERPAGHRSVPHTADARVEAWAPTRERCVAEAIAGLVETFADVSGARPAAAEDFQVPPGPDEDMLVAVLDRVVYLIDTTGQVPMNAGVSAADGGFGVRLELADPDAVEVTGAAPKAVSLHELRFAADEAGWSCGVTVDV